MAHRVQFKEEWGLVHLVHTGELDIHDAYAARYAVRDLLLAHNSRMVLADIRQANPRMSMDEAVKFFQSHRDLLPLGVRIALVVNAPIMSSPEALERVSKVSGVSQQAFGDEVTALEWLLN